MPVFFVLLVKFGIITTSAVTARRRYIYAVLYIVCAVITPDGGPIADIALFVPMAVLLELAVFFGKRIEKKQKVDSVWERSSRAMAKPVFLKCRFCGGLLKNSQDFCPTCGKSQV
jgi:sec-independent protein translocase protein TatC